jgi:cysteinyl-tRNA synthetase
MPDMDQVSRDLLDTAAGEFCRQVLSMKMKFLEMMDDDFNTAGAIAVLHELASAINSLMEQHAIEREKQPDLLQAVQGAGRTLKNLGLVLGLFRGLPSADGARDDAMIGKLMELLIKLRAEARAGKNFAMADGVRNGLAELGVTLEDRADGTGWRRE